ncbi:hypothetical protein [Halorubrum laminariae]|uniref:Roadblock/LC7 domain-containing protein n=1 Tax=Halorubrum laminariae TaxID=1433523 RepID=A0ABD6BZB0_9EURY|nr:hypothetical protein [Halorubrum laminariae]
MENNNNNSKNSIEKKINRRDVESLVQRLADRDVVAITASKTALKTGNLVLRAYGITNDDLPDEIHQSCQELSEGTSSQIVVETSLDGINTLDGFLLYADQDTQNNLNNVAPQMDTDLDNFYDEFVQQVEEVTEN